MNDTNMIGAADFIRAHELPERFPVFGRSTWNAIVAKGEVPSRKHGRKRIVRVADVVAFLEAQPASTVAA